MGLVNAQFVPEVTDVVPGAHLCMWPHREVHEEPAAGVAVPRPQRQALLLTEPGLRCPRRGVPVVSEGPPVTQHPVGQQPLWDGHGEVSHGGGVEEEGQLGAVTGVLVTERQPGPNAMVWGNVVENVHPNWTPRFDPCMSRTPSRTQEDVVCDNLRAKARSHDQPDKTLILCFWYIW